MIERTFRWLQNYRRLAIRFEKSADLFLANWTVGSILFWLRNPFSL